MPKIIAKPKRKTPIWSKKTEIVSLAFNLIASKDAILYPQYVTGLHAWFLDQVRSIDPDLSAYLHDGQSEKAFTISHLEGNLIASGQHLHAIANQSYRWYVTGLSQELVQCLETWLKQLPSTITLRHCPLIIQNCELALPATNYHELYNAEPMNQTIKLSFVTPTSFRRRSHHFPLPVPSTVFQSYLRRWNDFSGMEFDSKIFTDWVENNVTINRHRISSEKVAAGKRGMVTGFTGMVEFGLSSKREPNPEFEKLYYALYRLAPYCGTGHKTTFGLGQTRLGWIEEETIEPPSLSDILAQRIEELTEKFRTQRKRTGGERADLIAEKWATILGRRELGESIIDIAEDLEIPYETAKTYLKLARRAMKEDVN